MDNLPAFCRVAGEIKPTKDSDIKFEVWRPASGWNGKFMGVGNGGWSGEIWYPRMGGFDGVMPPRLQIPGTKAVGSMRVSLSAILKR